MISTTPMTAWRKICCAIDFSEASRAGLDGRTGRRRAAVGSVAEGVLRAARCPVLVVRRPDEG